MNIRGLRRKQRGQGMTEYIIIVALIAIAAIGIFGKFGDVVSNQMAASANELAGTNGDTEQQAATDAAQAARDTQNGREIGLNDYTDNGADD